ncbi:MAG: hypothetical protein U0441_14810 [Polyangiaceae bacterium]
MDVTTTDTDITTLSAHDVRRLAVEAMCDPRTVISFMKGAPMKGTTRARLVKAALALGFKAPPPPVKKKMGRRP